MSQSIPSTTEKNDGRIKPGERRSPATEFKPGEHWRAPQAFREKDWLQREYVEKQRSTGDISREFGVTEQAIMFWLRKHGIPRRSISEARAVKHWGAEGERNPMYGKRGAQAASWKGGVTPERQAFYQSEEWKRAARIARDRDHGNCQRCGRERAGRWDSALHHIVSFEVKPLRADPDNLVTLCVACHRWVHSKANVNREFIREWKGGDEDAQPSSDGRRRTRGAQDDS